MTIAAKARTAEGRGEECRNIGNQCRMLGLVGKSKNAVIPLILNLESRKSGN
jgi:hypothetical protein